MPASQQIAAVLWGLGVGAALIIVVWATVRGGWYRKPLVGSTRDLAELPEAHPHTEDSMPEVLGAVHEYPDGISEAHGPVPLIVKLVIISFTVWAIGYVVLFVQRGYTFT